MRCSTTNVNCGKRGSTLPTGGEPIALRDPVEPAIERLLKQIARQQN